MLEPGISALPGPSSVSLYITPHVDPHHLPALSNTHVDPTLKDPTVYQIRQLTTNCVPGLWTTERGTTHRVTCLSQQGVPGKDTPEWSLDEELGILQTGEAEA